MCIPVQKTSILKIFWMTIICLCKHSLYIRKKLLQWYWEMNEPKRTGLRRTLSRLNHQLMQVFAATVARVISSKAELRFSCWNTRLIFRALKAFPQGFQKIKNTIGSQCQSDWKCWGSFVVLQLPLLRNNVNFIS